MKPEKPSPDFPLFPHASKQWAKKIAGKLRYFGSWNDPEAALNRYRAEVLGVVETTPAKTTPVSLAKPGKPYKTFPLYAHASGQWAKRILGRTHYFGAWDDWKAALEKYERDGADLHQGREPRPQVEGLTVKTLCDAFLAAKRLLVESGELRPRTYSDYERVCERIEKQFAGRRVDDLRPDDFRKLRAAVAKTYGPVALGDFVNRARMVFKFGYDEELIEKPMRFGNGFDKPSRKTLRAARKPNLMFEPAELKAMLGAASKPLKAMILLGVNAGFGNTDCATLPLAALDLETGWVTYPRPKTAIERRIPLWPETVAALKEWLEVRPTAKTAHRGRVFVTAKGGDWERDNEDDPVSKECAKLLRRLKLKRPGLNFYCLRRTFETIGGESLDQVAVDSIMGHAPDSGDMAAVYRQRVTDERLRKVVAFVRAWAFAAPASADEAA